jgi:hypothetical protein
MYVRLHACALSPLKCSIQQVQIYTHARRQPKCQVVQRINTELEIFLGFGLTFSTRLNPSRSEACV